ncbi:MAG TPA: ABC transporter ATP-binding protein [Devosiaceae bacterium]|jgi:iron(III) transport system ATP-binding protein
MTELTLDAVGKRFGDSAALSGIDLDFPSGSFTALLGPSGCGKTTLLRLIAGFEAPSSGSVLFDGKVVASPTAQVAPEARGVGVVFQSYALWPHMDVAENVAYPLKARGIRSAAIAGKVEAALATVGLSGLGKRRTDELSGGQRQRVALARCLVADNRAILFDEPLANLDVHLRASMVEAFGAIHRETGATIVYVTHDQAEALALADRIAVLDAGRIQQLATPQEIYAAPANAMVAGFVGRGNLVKGHANGNLVHIGDYGFGARGKGDGPVALLLRPEALRLAETGIPALITSQSYKGPVYEVQLAIVGSGDRLTLDSVTPQPLGATVHVAVADGWIVPGG